jgi:hypothetical protein
MPRRKDAKGIPTLNSMEQNIQCSNVSGSSFPVETCQVSEAQIGDDGHNTSTLTDTSVTDTVNCCEPINTDTENCSVSPSSQPDPDTSNIVCEEEPPTSGSCRSPQI